MTLLADLLSPDTASAVKARLFAGLRKTGFPVDSWSAFSVPRALLEVFAAALADATLRTTKIAQLGFLSYSSGAWLTLLAREVYDLDRIPAKATVGSLHLAAAPSAGPYSLEPGELVAAAPNGLLYRNRDAFTLPRGGTIDLAVVGESPGAAWNLVLAGAPFTLATPLPGVAVSNPPDASTGTWIVEQGADEEDDASLRLRCRQQWSTLGAGGNDDAYAYWARAASPEIARVRVRSAYPLPGQVTIIVAGAAGPASAAAIAVAQTLIDPP
jgi:phage-related baseplate assembly protein